jgi:hypothetical protein
MNLRAGRLLRRGSAALFAVVIGMTFVVGCSSAPKPQTAADKPLDDAWVMSSGFGTRIRLTADQPGGVHLDVRVLVDSTGHADMSALEISGAGSSQNRDAITQALMNATFKPSPRNPSARAGYFHIRT